MTRVTSEDVTGISFASHPAEVDFTTFGGRSVATLPPRAIPDIILRDIERAIFDKGYRHGVKAVTVEIIREEKRTRLRARITYG
jgi:hypothetical protein